jgi:mitochondrial fission protein ELM1
MTAIWLLQGKLAGDNAQVQALGDFLAAERGWSIEVKPISSDLRQAGKQLFPRMPKLSHFAASGMAAPWPDLVIACGSTPCVIARWIKQRSGGRTVHVQLGRIRALPHDIDLIVETAQYGVPPTSNMVTLTLPFVRRDPARQAAALAEWQPKLAALPRPWLGVLVGGPASPIRFGGEEAAGLLRRVAELHRSLGGSVLVALGQRTPLSVREIVEAGMTRQAGPYRLFGWPPPAPPAANPYPALLALCDRFLVTSDSASMIADAGITDKPLELFMLPESHGLVSWRGLGLSIDTRRRARARAGLPADALDRFRDFLVRNRLMIPYRDMRDLLHVLQRAGVVGDLEKAKPGIGRELQQQELAKVGVRVAGLLRDAARHQAGKAQAGKVQAGKI